MAIFLHVEVDLIRKGGLLHLIHPFGKGILAVGTAMEETLKDVEGGDGDR
jgi:hypothetical protein